MENLDGEFWLPVVGYEGIYEVSNKGRVRSCFQPEKLAYWYSKITKPQTDAYGYHTVFLSVNKNRKRAKVHRLVAMAFILNPHNKPQVNHKDGNKKNNCVENLEWNTPAENVAHSMRLNLKPVGSRCHSSKIKEEDVLFIRKHKQLFSTKELSEKYKIDTSTIRSIINGTTWKHVPLNP